MSKIYRVYVHEGRKKNFFFWNKEQGRSHRQTEKYEPIYRVNRVGASRGSRTHRRKCRKRRGVSEGENQSK